VARSIAIRGYDDTPPVTFATGVFAAYSAVVYSRLRQPRYRAGSGEPGDLPSGLDTATA